MRTPLSACFLLVLLLGGCAGTIQTGFEARCEAGKWTPAACQLSLQQARRSRNRIHLAREIRAFIGPGCKAGTSCGSWVHFLEGNSADTSPLFQIREESDTVVLSAEGSAWATALPAGPDSPSGLGMQWLEDETVFLTRIADTVGKVVRVERDSESIVFFPPLGRFQGVLAHPASTSQEDEARTFAEWLEAFSVSPAAYEELDRLHGAARDEAWHKQLTTLRRLLSAWGPDRPFLTSEVRIEGTRPLWSHPLIREDGGVSEAALQERVRLLDDPELDWAHPGILETLAQEGRVTWDRTSLMPLCDAYLTDRLRDLQRTSLSGDWESRMVSVSLFCGSEKGQAELLATLFRGAEKSHTLWQPLATLWGLWRESVLTHAEKNRLSRALESAMNTLNPEGVPSTLHFLQKGMLLLLSQNPSDAEATSETLHWLAEAMKKPVAVQDPFRNWRPVLSLALEGLRVPYLLHSGRTYQAEERLDSLRTRLEGLTAKEWPPSLENKLSRSEFSDLLKVLSGLRVDFAENPPGKSGARGTLSQDLEHVIRHAFRSPPNPGGSTLQASIQNLDEALSSDTKGTLVDAVRDALDMAGMDRVLVDRAMEQPRNGLEAQRTLRQASPAKDADPDREWTVHCRNRASDRLLPGAHALDIYLLSLAAGHDGAFDYNPVSMSPTPPHPNEKWGCTLAEESQPMQRVRRMASGLRKEKRDTQAFALRFQELLSAIVRVLEVDSRTFPLTAVGHSERYRKAVAPLQDLAMLSMSARMRGWVHGAQELEEMTRMLSPEWVPQCSGGQLENSAGLCELTRAWFARNEEEVLGRLTSLKNREEQNLLHSVYLATSGNLEGARALARTWNPETSVGTRWKQTLALTDPAASDFKAQSLGLLRDNNWQDETVELAGTVLLLAHQAASRGDRGGLLDILGEGLALLAKANGPTRHENRVLKTWLQAGGELTAYPGEAAALKRAVTGGDSGVFDAEQFQLNILYLHHQTQRGEPLTMEVFLDRMKGVVDPEGTSERIPLALLWTLRFLKLAWGVQEGRSVESDLHRLHGQIPAEPALTEFRAWTTQYLETTAGPPRTVLLEDYVHQLLGIEKTAP